MSELRRIRIDLRRWSIRELAERSGVSEEQIRNIEKGRTKHPRAETLGKLADALTTDGVPVAPSDLDPVFATAEATP